MVLVHGIPAALAEALSSGPSPALPALERLLSRGHVVPAGREVPGWCRWHVALLDALGLAVDETHGAALLEWLGAGGELRPGSWLKADFVHLAIGTRRLVVESAGALTPVEVTELAATVASHMQESGFALRSPPEPVDGSWYLHSDTQLDVFCPLPPEAADVRDSLPRGPDAARLGRLLTEVQMLLHDHPVNVRREREGLRPVNAVWLSGHGHAGPVDPVPLPALFGSEPFVGGLARRYGRDCLPVPRDEADMVAAARGCIVRGMTPGDGASALEVLDRTLLQPLLASVQRGALEELQLALEEWIIRVDRRALRRFWRRTSLGMLQAAHRAGEGA